MLRPFLVFCSLCLLACTPVKTNPNSPYPDVNKYPMTAYYHKFTEPVALKPKLPDSRVKVTKVQYQPLAEKRGFWTGLVEGNGDYNLRLNFYRKNRIFKSQNIGSRSLLPEDGPMWFKFNSSLPKMKNYTWKIEAYQQ